MPSAPFLPKARLAAGASAKNGIHNKFIKNMCQTKNNPRALDLGWRDSRRITIYILLYNHIYDYSILHDYWFQLLAPNLVTLPRAITVRLAVLSVMFAAVFQLLAPILLTLPLAITVRLAVLSVMFAAVVCHARG
jgi:hypothetical protein